MSQDLPSQNVLPPAAEGTTMSKPNKSETPVGQPRLVRQFRIEDWPDAADGIEIAGRLRIGWFARHMAFMPTWFWAGRCRKPGYQIRFGRLGIAYTWKPFCGRNDLPNEIGEAQPPAKNL
jgi:hypothetical protein